MHMDKVYEFPSLFFCPKTKLLLAVYVDDFTLSGPAEAHDEFWAKLSQHVDLEPCSELGRVLGRQHAPITSNGVPAMAFDMEDYAQQACDLYEGLDGAKPLKHAATPFLPDGSLVEADSDNRGELASSACSVLMKNLWLARLARPDIIRAIGLLATKVQNWSLNEDKALYRLMCYINSTKDLMLYGEIADESDTLRLIMFTDADFCGDKEHTKSTSGGFLVLVGPNTFFPLAWLSKAQTATSRSTTESEAVSLAMGFFSEALPALSLWELILDRTVELHCLQDNEATIKVIENGWSAKLRHVLRTHKVNLGSLAEQFEDDNVHLDPVGTKEQAADIFTKNLAPHMWQAALDMLHMKPKKELPPRLAPGFVFY